MIRFKLKYRFWGCVDPETEALTRRGWKKHEQVNVADEILTLNPLTDEIEWQPVEAVGVYPYKGEMHHWTGKVDALTTPNHRWLAEVRHGRAQTLRTNREIVFSGMHPSQGQLVTGGGTPLEFADQPKWDDEFVETIAPSKQLTPEFLCSLTFSQAKLLYETLLDVDGCRLRGQERWTQIDQGRVDSFQMLSAMLGMRSRYFQQKVTNYVSRCTSLKELVANHEEIIDYDGDVWCPTVKNSIWFARRNGTTYWTGNTALEGTRQVFSFTELWTEDAMQSFINDEIVESQANPLGVIPFVHISNTKVPSSPWGLSDIQDITDLNRQYNETMTEINDIINYYACVDDKTEALTKHGWVCGDRLCEGDEILALNPITDEITWEPVKKINKYPYNGDLIHWTNHVDALTTPNHRWLVERRTGNLKHRRYVRQFARTAEASIRTSLLQVEEPAVRDVSGSIVLGGGTPTCFSTVSKYDDEFVETIGWFVTEGCISTLPSGSQIITLSQSEKVNAEYVRDIRRIQQYWKGLGSNAFTEQKPRDNGVVCWYLGTSIADAVLSVAPGKVLSPLFLTSLTYQQAKLLYKVLVDADGTRGSSGRSPRISWSQEDSARRDGFQMLTAMLGIRTRNYKRADDVGMVDVYRRNTSDIPSTISSENARSVHYEGTVWCPTVSTSVWLARRNGSTYWTGNSPVTIITGAKASNLERGPKKVWALANEHAKVENLELSMTGLDGPLRYVEMIKEKMHEIVGIPINALGQEIAISNTSGVALSLQFLPLMQKTRQKAIQFSAGFAQLNELIIRTAALFLPDLLKFNPDRDTPPEEGQLTELDPRDPLTYRNTVEFASPLPLDKLVILNEIQMEMALGIESKTGALYKLGEAYPKEKLEELLNELQEDTLEQGALDLVKAHIQLLITMMTGISSDGAQPQNGASGGGQGVQSAGGPGVNSASGVQAPQSPAVDLAHDPELSSLYTQLMTMVAGTKIPQIRNPLKDSDE